MKRRQFVIGGVALASVLAGCIGRGSRVAAGTAVRADGITVNVTGVDVSEHLYLDGDERFPRAGSIFALAWISIENEGDSDASLPNPIGRISIMYEDQRARYITGTFDEVGLDGEIYPSYRSGYRARDGSLPAGDTVEGYGPLFEIPASYDPAEVEVTIEIDGSEYSWWLEVDE